MLGPRRRPTPRQIVQASYAAVIDIKRESILSPHLVSASTVRRITNTNLVRATNALIAYRNPVTNARLTLHQVNQIMTKFGNCLRKLNELAAIEDKTSWRFSIAELRLMGARGLLLMKIAELLR